MKNKPLSIVIDVSQIVYTGTGVGRYTYELCRAILKLNTPHTFTFFAGVLREKEKIKKISKTKPFDQASWQVVPLPPKIAGLVFNYSPISIDRITGTHDVFHTSDWTQPVSHMATVTTVHDLVFRKYPETVDPLIKQMHEARLERIVRGNVHIIADSESTKRDLMDIYALPEERITVVYPGISQDMKPANKNEIDRVKKKYNLPDQFILSLGTQEPRKNLSKLAEAANAAKLPLILAGRHGWGERTRTLGYIPDSDLPALYSSATVFAFPSLYEGFGFPVVEAMACGTPVVTSRVSSLPEVAGDAAILVDPTDVLSIKSGLENAVTNAKILQKAGLLQAQKFSWEKTARCTVEVYEKLAG